MSDLKIINETQYLPHQLKLMEKFFNRRDERNEIVLERLEAPDTTKESLEKSCGSVYERVDFKHHGKSYWYYHGQWHAIQSLEWFPKMGGLREILGVPWQISGIDYAYPIFARQVTWSLWGGTPTEKQADRIWNIATKREEPLNPWRGW